jgi:trehalose 6-phosphate synthase
MATIRRHDVHWWCSEFLDTLAETESRESGTPWLRL